MGGNCLSSAERRPAGPFHSPPAQIGSCVQSISALFASINHQRVWDSETSGRTLAVGAARRSNQGEDGLRVSRTEDRAETDQAFSHLEATFRALVEQIPAIVYVWAVRGGTDDIVDEYVSPQIEAILGFRPDEWTNDPSLWVRRLHEDDRKDVLAEASRSVDAGEPFRMEYRMVAKDGRVVWLSDRAAVLARDEAGRAVRYQGGTARHHGTQGRRARATPEHRPAPTA
jgi:PAS domain S-box-containing protein